MKTNALSKWAAICLSAISLNAAVAAGSAKSGTADHPDKTCAGVVALVDANDRVLEIRSPLVHRHFTLGENCSFVFVDKGPGKLADLHPGQKVDVSYHNVGGARIADAVQQQPMLFEGRITAIDPKARIMRVTHLGLEKSFRIADTCAIDLNGGGSGDLPNLKPGNMVTVTYESPEDINVARRITRGTQTFTGDLTAIDLNDRMVKAQGFLEGKQFDVAPNCAIVLNGNSHARLGEVMLGQKAQFDYVDDNGKNTVNTITVLPGSTPQATASTESPNQYPVKP